MLFQNSTSTSTEENLCHSQFFFKISCNRVSSKAPKLRWLKSLRLQPATFNPNANDLIFYFDEIQIIEGWDKFIRRLIDKEKMAIFITGSSAKTLSKEIATSLRGRSLTNEIFPLGFIEYLNYHGILGANYRYFNFGKVGHYSFGATCLQGCPIKN